MRLRLSAPRWMTSVDLFLIAALLALFGHLGLSILLSAAKTAGVDFLALDSRQIVVPLLQIALFAGQTALMVFALARSQLRASETYIGVAALLWAMAMLMITFVAAQCELYGACL
jgi:hypothetical protein